MALIIEGEDGNKLMAKGEKIDGFYLFREVSLDDNLTSVTKYLIHIGVGGECCEVELDQEYWEMIWNDDEYLNELAEASTVKMYVKKVY